MARILAFLPLALALGALAQPVATLTPLQPTTKLWRDRLDFRVDLGGTCGTPAPVSGRADLVLPTLTWTTALTGVSCTAGALHADPVLFTNQEAYLWFGVHVVSARGVLSTGAGTIEAPSQPAVVTVLPDASLAGPGGPIDVGLADPYGQTCASRSYARHDTESAPVPRPPTAKRVIFGYAAFGVTACGIPSPSQSFILREPAGAPAGVELWIHESSTNAWRLGIPTHDFPDQLGSWAAGIGGRVDAVLALAYPNRDSFAADVNGLWWGGPDQDGWGLDVSRVDDRLFAALFIHDGSSVPRWAVMPAGRWDATQLAWVGDLYMASGNPFALGPPAGAAVLAFDDDAHGFLTYTLLGAQGMKTIQRFDSPGTSPAQGNTGLWWTPALAGRGLSVRTVGDSVFATWYTYDANGEPTWYDMPGGTWSGKTISGPLYRMRGTPWPGSHETASLQAIPAGSAALDFGTPGVLNAKLQVGTELLVLPLQRFTF